MAKKNQKTPRETTPAPAVDETATPEPKKTPVAAKVLDLSNKNNPPAKPQITSGEKTTPPTRANRRWLWIGVAAGVAILAGAALTGYLLTKSPTNENTAVTPVENTNREVLFPRAIDGVLVPADKANGNLFAVMIENISESRPPSGLDKASVVYEALAEGGITRFLAIFPVGVDVKEIGPVRSARSYYIDWASEYKPLYVHAGGSPQAIELLRSGKANVIDFNQFVNGGNFWRDKTKRAPHNLYTNTSFLYLGLKRAAPDAKPTYTPWSFQDEPGIDARPATSKDIVIDFSSFNYRVKYQYDRGTNSYQRYLGDKEHVTRDGAKITTKNIVVLYTKTSLVPNDKLRLAMETVGTGKLVLFRDGQTFTGTWKKTALAARTQLLGDNGQTLALDRGTTWVEVVPNDRSVTY